MPNDSHTELSRSIITQPLASVTEGVASLGAKKSGRRRFVFPDYPWYRLETRPSLSNQLRAYFGEERVFLPEAIWFYRKWVYLPGVGEIPYVPHRRPFPRWPVGILLKAIVNHWFLFLHTYRVITIPLPGVNQDKRMGGRR